MLIKGVRNGSLLKHNKVYFLLFIVVLLIFLVALVYYFLIVNNIDSNQRGGTTVDEAVTLYDSPTKSRPLKFGLVEEGEDSEGRTSYWLTGWYHGKNNDGDAYWLTISMPGGEVDVYLGMSDSFVSPNKIIRYLRDDNKSVRIDYYEGVWSPVNVSDFYNDLDLNNGDPISIRFLLSKTNEKQMQVYEDFINDDRCDAANYCPAIAEVWKSGLADTRDVVGKLLKGELVSGKLILPIANIALI